MYKVILVDDEHIIVEGLRRVLPWEEMGCTVSGTAADGLSGLALIREQKPDILFTDIRMPNMDGLTMLAAVRSEFPRMQISVLTAFRDFDYTRINEKRTALPCRPILPISEYYYLKITS